MDRLLIYLARCAMILVGYAVAALVASAAMHLLLLPRIGFEKEMTTPVVTAVLFWSIPFMALFIAYIAFIPSMMAIALAEAMPARSWLYYALAGGVIGVVLAVLSPIGGQDFLAAGSELENIPTRRSMHDPAFPAILAGAGMLGGLAYWLVAGRGAGSWRGVSRGAQDAPTLPER